MELKTLSFAEIREALPNTYSKPPSCAAVSRSFMPTRTSTRSLSIIPTFATYLERDVRALAGMLAVCVDFERFLRACALRSANQSRSGAGCWNRTFDSESVAVHAGGFRPSCVA